MSTTQADLAQYTTAELRSIYTRYNLAQREDLVELRNQVVAEITRRTAWQRR